MTTLYGIPNCDTVKAARAWLDQAGIDYRFHDFRRDGLTEAQAAGWIAELGWEVVVNRRGTTWRRLDAAVRDQMSAEAAIATILAEPALIKRPLLDTGTARHVGFSADAYRAIFA